MQIIFTKIKLYFRKSIQFFIQLLKIYFYFIFLINKQIEKLQTEIFKYIIAGQLFIYTPVI